MKKRHCLTKFLREHYKKGNYFQYSASESFQNAPNQYQNFKKNGIEDGGSAPSPNPIPFSCLNKPIFRFLNPGYVPCVDEVRSRFKRYEFDAKYQSPELKLFKERNKTMNYILLLLLLQFTLSTLIPRAQ